MPSDATWTPIRGSTTATETNVAYRIGLIRHLLSGRWLDFGCADGGYDEALLASGATSVVGIDVEPERVEAASARGLSGASYLCFDGGRIPLADASVDGAFVNEVLEHVADEGAALDELRRVLRPEGVLVVISPNRWFPFEGHGITLGRFHSGPAPLVPWLPSALTRPVLNARNYWPHELAFLVRDHGFTVEEMGFVWPVFESYRWLPRAVIAAYRARLQRIDDLPVLRRLGVSTLIVATPCRR